MVKNFNKLNSKLSKPKSSLKKLEKEVEKFSLGEKQQLLKNINQMYVEKKKYVPEKGKLYHAEISILDFMVCEWNSTRKLANFILLLSFDTLSLKDKMKTEFLVSNFIDDDTFSKEKFESNLLDIVDNEFILSLDTSIDYFPYLLERWNLSYVWKKMKIKILKEQEPLTLDKINELEKELY